MTISCQTWGIEWASEAFPAELDELAKSYVAQKRYGSNVVLAWWNEQRDKGTDERWDRLDAVMHEIANG